MEVRHPSHPNDAKHYTTDRLRQEFLVQGLFVPGNLKMVYTHFDRMIIGGACPQESLPLKDEGMSDGDFLLERREMGIINVGAQGTVMVDNREYDLDFRDALYIGKGAREISFSSSDLQNPAKFYFNCGTAHAEYPTVKISIEEADPTHLGSLRESNERTLYKFIHPDGIKSCQLLMGLTQLEPNNVWNTMPCHLHERRMEAYLYFGIPDEAVVFHLMGQAEETRHIVVRNEEAIFSPSWSIHSGVGTRNYSFIWGMVGENQQFTDMDAVPMSLLK
jgi:4-deoxy-L-threo-5-hexosulose-uronate ketol-isomerase